MKITHVIRGDDHLSNTPRQVMVYEALGAPVPTFAHISMILGADGKKLSKRHGATSVEEYRDAGYLSDAFVNYLALLGWSLDGETTIIPRDVLASKFSLDRISKNPATFDPKKLDWVNAEYINGMSDAQFADEIMVPELHEAGLIEGNVEYGEDWIDALAAIVKPRTKMPADAVTVAAPIFATAETLEYDEKSVNKGLAKEGMGAVLDAAKAALDEVQSMNLPELLIVSQALIGDDVPADAVTGTGTNFPGLHISVRNAPGVKCPRCWMHSEQADPETGLCPRCAAAGKMEQKFSPTPPGSPCHPSNSSHAIKRPTTGRFFIAKRAPRVYAHKSQTLTEAMQNQHSLLTCVGTFC